MPFRVTSEPSVEPITATELKAFLRISDTSEDTLIGTLITAARQHIEALTRRPMITQTIAATYPDWPSDKIFPLPVGNNLTITGLTYWPDPASTQVTVNAANYVVISVVQPGKVVLIDTYSEPDIYDREDALTITGTYGFGAAAVNVPEALKLAVKHLAAHWFELRLPVAVGNIVNPIPMHVQALIDRYRVITPEL